MKIKSVVIISIFSIITLLLIYSYKHLCYYSEMKYGSNTEHIDIKVSGLKFDILHYIIDKDSRLVLSEEMSGISLRKLGGGYIFFPLHSYQSAPNGQPKGSLKSLGSVLSVCIYEVDNQKKNIVSFINGDRGFIEINGETIHLSSLLLGLQGKHTHASYHLSVNE
ncbi:TPA: protein psaF [Yersinia enterocolitica]|uniref:fimbrial polyadhesin regulatory protein MyfF n=1 Tax=Yersinia enterocolitica TaxID=630 RepID=UPI0006246E3F|nr:fimbrial polyadhesin regulatory protein MyfF [Yersinia enterocolitica]AKF37635.1 protein psaF [Yersinia enterocolitica]ALG45776.1 protein psaF [Yersinia enterocolitica]EKN6009239.1 protein psaF [Yersinia enterocolitica]HDL7178016.1 protein psaF [Yersinia enterocolitica]HDL7318197.1 protein psaF [Yersinia enterocolitica]